MDELTDADRIAALEAQMLAAQAHICALQNAITAVFSAISHASEASAAPKMLMLMADKHRKKSGDNDNACALLSDKFAETMVMLMANTHRP